MESKHQRKPVGNFFIKKELQMRLIVKVALTVVLSTLITTGTLIAVYFARYQNLVLYQMDQNANLTRENVVFILLPTLIISALVNVIVAVFVGLYASRKYAVPIYKLERWVALLLGGNLNARLRFREKAEMRELCDECNTLTDELMNKFMTIQKQNESLSRMYPDSIEVKRIREVLETLSMGSDLIEVHTTVTKHPLSGVEQDTAAGTPKVS